MYEVVSVAGSTTWLQWLLLVLFTLNFSWIARARALSQRRRSCTGMARGASGGTAGAKAAGAGWR
jgi:hypothetical protein